MIDVQITNVEEKIDATVLAADVAAGAGSFDVMNLHVLDADGGTLGMYDQITGVYLEELTYTVPDPEGTLVQLVGTLANSYTADNTLVRPLPETKERWVWFLGISDDEPQQARLPMPMWPLLPLDARPSDEGEWAQVQRVGNDLVVFDVLGTAPDMTGEFLRPDTIPYQRDHVVPAAPGTPTVRGGIGSLVVTWPAVVNNDPVTYEVHVSPTSGFTPGPTTLAATTDGTMAWVRVLPDGSTFDYTATYYVKVVATDIDGDSAPSAEASGSPAQVTGPDIQAESVTADQIVADDALFAKLQALLIVANVLKTAETGQRIEIGIDGIKWFDQLGNIGIFFPTATGQPAVLNADLVASTLEVVGQASFRGVANLEIGSTMSLASIQGNPAVAPSLAVGVEALTLTGGNSEQAGGNCIGYASNGGTGGGTPVFFVTQEKADGSSVLEEYRASDGVFLRQLYADGNATFPAKFLGAAQLTVSGTRYIFLLVYQPGFTQSEHWWIEKIRASDGAGQGEANISGDIPSNGPGDASPTAACLGVVNSNLTVVTFKTGGASVARLLTYSGTMALTGTQDCSGRNYTPVTKQSYRFVGVVDDGTSLWIAVKGDPIYHAIVHRYNKTTFAYEANHDFTAYSGLVHDGTRFWSRAAGGPVLRKHTNWDWTTASSKYWVGYTWADASHETVVSPLQSLDLTTNRRHRLQITVPAFPSGITKAKVYVAPSASAPASGSLHYQAATSYVDSETGVTRFEIDYDSTGAAPPGSSNFGTAGVPAKIKSNPSVSGLEAWEQWGDGSMKLVKGTTAELATFTPGAGEACVAYDETLQALSIWTGAAWVPLSTKWQTWNITWTNLTEGNGTEVAQFIQVGKVVFYRVLFTLGTTSSIGGSVSMDLPVTAVAGVGAIAIGQATYVVGGVRYIGEAGLSGNTAVLRVLDASGAYAKAVALAAAIPAAWGSGDLIIVSGWYRV
jgi:hypothetical protein